MAFIGSTACTVYRKYWEWGWVPLTRNRKRKPIYEVVMTWEIDRTGGETVSDTAAHSEGPTCLLQSVVPSIEHGKPFGILTATYRYEGAVVPYP